MSFPFDPQQGLIIVPAEVFGPSRSIIVRLALDTGATATLINPGPLVVVGYDPSLISERVQVTTGSGVEYVPQIKLAELDALGHKRSSFSVLSHTLPPSAGIDGLLGLDFFRGQVLLIDFEKGTVSLSLG